MYSPLRQHIIFPSSVHLPDLTDHMSLAADGPAILSTFHIISARRKGAPMTLAQLAESKKRQLLGEKRKIETREYIPHRNRSLARKLAKKKLCLQRLQDINAELKAIDMYLKAHRDNTDLDTILRTPAYGTLLFEEGFKMYGTMSEELQEWAHEEYEINPKDPELRNVPTVDGIKVRSKSEALIVMLLSVNHIPYRYECRLDVGGHAYYPDFTIRHPVTGEYFYWEHCGKMSDFKYIIKFLNKFRIYILNGYLPDHNLILTFESENHPFDITIAQDKLREFLICKDPFKCA